MLLPGHCKSGYVVAGTLEVRICCCRDTVSRYFLLLVHSKEGYGVARTL